MKRISVLTIVMLTVVPCVTKARSYIPLRYRTHYSPYAFNYHNSGLVPGMVRYSPHAFNYYNSGLVHRNVRYSPYAFGHKHSGLIADYSCFSFFGPYYFLYGSHDMKNSYEMKPQAHRQTTRNLIHMTREKDGKEIICKYLKSKNIDFKMNRLLKAGNKTLSVDFLLKDGNIIIKYWSPADIRQIVQHPGYKKNMYERYIHAWMDFYEKYKQTGGKVYQITSANEKQILGRLAIIHSELFCKP